MKKLAILTALLLAVAGCNTIDGIGQDMKAAGSAVDDAVN
jgi:predicted small secreted protein